MHYCEVTPRNNRGKVHIKTLISLTDCKLEFNTDSKFLSYKDFHTGQTHEIVPVCECKQLDKSQHNSKNFYEFKLALKFVENSLKEHIEKDLLVTNILQRSCYTKEACKTLEKLSLFTEKQSKILKGFTKGDSNCKVIKLSTENNLVYTSFLISCRDLVITGLGVESIDIKPLQEGFLLNFTIPIEINGQLNYLDLKVDSLASGVDPDVIKGSKDLVIRCKNCEFEVQQVRDFKVVNLPSDLYLNSIGSVYCEECQDNLVGGASENKVELVKNNRILYVSDETVLSVHALDSKHTHHIRCSSNNNTVGISNVNQRAKEINEVGCPGCKKTLGFVDGELVSYQKNRIAAEVNWLDLFWKHSEAIDEIDRIQLSEKRRIVLGCGRELITIIKVSKEPDTFIFVQNNPVLTTRILYKIASQTETTEEVEELDAQIFDHIKEVIKLFADTNSGELIPSLLPKI